MPRPDVPCGPANWPLNLNWEDADTEGGTWAGRAVVEAVGAMDPVALRDLSG